VKLVIKSIAGEPVQLLVYDRDRIEAVEVEGKGLEKVEMQFQGDLPILEGESRWYYDGERYASLLLVNFEEDGEIDVSVKV
jgi:hypothetical protein